MKKLATFFFLLCCLSLAAGNINVRVLSSMNVFSANISVYAGSYDCYINDIQQPDSIATQVFQLSVVNDSLEIRIPGDTLGLFSSFRIVARTDSSAFKIKPIRPMSGTRVYDHSLKITVRDGKLLCINEVELEHYVAGVVESESGGRTAKEFYKVQAILCRTYALAHMSRHAPEGFDLCDGVHCQAYRGRP
ncbi:MAG TPA: SpoIID/LytB domain-containing protein, partial [Bacteroidia bacterium]|nr:SpoIID/LytB domain-containing protein [Bacteroidia bacterium]